MAIRQYIGARYVPRFMGTYDASQQYEVLDVVDNGMGTSYILKKPANTGTPVTNTTYWAIYGATSGAIINLQNQIDDLRDDFDNEVGEYIVWIGDSYTGASSLGADIDKRFSTLVSHMLGLTEKNYAVGGCSFNVGTTPFPNQVQNAINDFNTNNLDKNKVKYVMIAGTRNDGIISGSQAAAYEAAVQNTVNSVATAFPNAKIIIVPMMWDCSFLPTAYLESIKRMKWAICLNDFSDRVQIIDYCYTWLSAQYCYILYQGGVNVHPNVIGHRIIAKKLYSAMMGHNFDTSSYIEMGDFVNNYSGKFTIDKTNHDIHLYIEVHTPASITNTQIFSKTINMNMQIEEFSFGNQQIMSNFKTRNALHNNIAMPVCPYYVKCAENKTGDSSGTLTLEIKAFAGNIQPNEIYFDNIHLKNGVLNAPYEVS